MRSGMQQARRSHLKSRNGCFECKRRRMKCNEEKPICSGCVKRSLECEYPRPRSPQRVRNGLRHIAKAIPSHGWGDLPTTSSLSLHESANSLAAPKSLGKFDAEDMVLWHHFFTRTAETMASGLVDQLPALVTSCEYLMHGILSIAALHLAYLNPNLHGKYSLLSTRHQNIALGPFQRAMSNINESNCNQVFAFSMILIISHFASFSSPDLAFPDTGRATDNRLSSWIIFLRGCSSILYNARSHILSGPLGSLLDVGKVILSAEIEKKDSQQDEDDQSLEYLLYHIKNLQSVKTSTTVAEMEAYMDAINKLRRLLALSLQERDWLSLRAFACALPAMVTDTFVRLLNEERPPALVIMLHYCLLLKRCHSCWYMEHRAYDLFQLIRQSLDHEWATYVQHPLRVFGVDPDGLAKGGSVSAR